MKLTAVLRYLRTVLVHKWYVLGEAWQLGIPWRGLVHDLDKLHPREWGARSKAATLELKDDDGNLVGSNVNDALAQSWLRHYHANPHHWQWWVIRLDSGEIRVLAMSDTYRRELLADWLAVSRAPGRMAVVPWYLANRDKMLLHPETRQWLETKLGI